MTQVLAAGTLGELELAVDRLPVKIVAPETQVIQAAPMPVRAEITAQETSPLPTSAELPLDFVPAVLKLAVGLVLFGLLITSPQTVAEVMTWLVQTMHDLAQSIMPESVGPATE